MMPLSHFSESKEALYMTMYANTSVAKVK